MVIGLAQTPKGWGLRQPGNLALQPLHFILYTFFASRLQDTLEPPILTPLEIDMTSRRIYGSDFTSRCR
jgi:hypothetical protein